MKRILSALLATALLLTCLAACGDSGASSASSGSSESTSSDASSASSEDSVSTTAASNEPVTFSIFIDHPWFWVDKWGGDPVSAKITEETGVSFDVTRATDDQQLALLIAADDLPDFVYTATAATIALLSDPNVCYSYNELVEETGVDIHADEIQIANNTRSDGNYYSLLNAYTPEEDYKSGKAIPSGGTNSIAYRTDIWEDIGSPEINTLEDLENALLACKEMYPNIIPLLPDQGVLWYFAGQLGMKGGGSVGYDKDGNPCYFLGEEGLEDYFKLLNRYAREGLISAESMTYSYDKFCEVRNSGNTFMQIRSADEAQASNAAAAESGSGLKWKLITHELSDDALINVDTGIGWSGTFITKKNPNPQRSIEFMSWCRSEEGRKLCSWGIQGEHWDYNENGETVTTPEYQKALNEGKQKQKDFGIAVWIFGDQGDENAFIDHGVTDPDAKDYFARLIEGAKHKGVMSELYFCTPTEGDELNIFNALNDMYKSESLKVIFAESDEAFQSALDSMYSQAEDLGMSKLNDWMKVQLDEYNARMK